MSVSATEIQDQKFNTLGLSKMIVNETLVCTYSRDLGQVSDNHPVLVLIHGYPQSAYMWRHLIPLFPPNAPLFVPDLPGYGASAPIKENDKLTVGTTILSALQTVVKRSSSSTFPSPIPVILIGHDRGARVAHRLAVSGAEGIRILGLCLIDIVPTQTQWAASSNAREAMGYFHWPFLANVEVAQKMISAYGGDRWCEEMILLWAGKNPNGLANLKSDNSLKIYSEFFKNPQTIEASSLDYLAGATTDVDAQKEDQAQGRRIPCPVLLIYSKHYIGSRFDVRKEWEEWVKTGVSIQDHALGNDIGHFGAEEAPEESARVVWGWLRGLGVNF
ncbi:alpha/beta-hydrolase [Zopfia rhizophila CBS 207.26]|uniref:Alpha/beta-hydrolase n=1 Tax=Zopfia rhizophila CBS 207.26 TaxID=1314779 RepID=A0A6A6EWR9_9PEZI|nr:alpha/beta-hydrolase [Zopfia rhizophila CBS 207.26]